MFAILRFHVLFLKIILKLLLFQEEFVRVTAQTC